MAKILFLFLIFSLQCLYADSIVDVKADSKGVYFEDQLFIPDDILIQIKSKQVHQAAKVEKLLIDVSAYEKKWKGARLKLIEIENQEQGDSLFNPSINVLKARVLWEQVRRKRLELENETLRGKILDWHMQFREQFLYLKTSGKKFDQWDSLGMSARAFQKELRQSQVLISKRRYENIHVASQLEKEYAGDSLKAVQMELKSALSKLESQLILDSLMLNYVEKFQSSLAAYIENIQDNEEKISSVDKAWIMLKKVWKILNYQVYNTAEGPISLGKLILSLLLISLGVFIAKFTSRFTFIFVRSKFNIEAGVGDAGQKLMFYVLSVLLVLYSLNSIKFPLTAFTFLGGALALGIGFGSQNILNNFISGIIMLLERPIKVGDLVEVDNIIGVIESIGMRSTRLLTPSNIHLVIPNSSFLEKNVTNWTLSDRKVRLEFTIGVAYGSDVELVKQILIDACEKTNGVLGKPPPIVLFSDFADSSLNFQVLIWIRINKLIDRRMVTSNIRFKVNQLFKENGIEIPFPQLDVTLKKNE